MRSRHEIALRNAPDWYLYKADAIDWPDTYLVDQLALYNSLKKALEVEPHPESIKTVKTTPPSENLPSTRKKVQEQAALLDAAQVAAKLGKTPATIRNWVRKHAFPCTMIQGKYYFREADVEAWIENRLKYSF